MSTNEKLAPGYGDAYPPEPVEHDEYASITDALNVKIFRFVLSLSSSLSVQAKPNWQAFALK